VSILLSMDRQADNLSIAVLADKEPDWNLIRGWENPRKKWKNDPNNWPTEVNGAKPYTYLRGE
jgi:hypothetical protein